MSSFCRIFYRIPFSETDAMGIVHHSNHPKYMERGRVEFLRHVGMSYAEVVKEGIHFPVIEMSLHYKFPIAFDNIVMVETTVSKLSKTRLSFSYKLFLCDAILQDGIFDSPHTGTPVLFGETHHCSVNNTGRPVEMPARVQNKLSAIFKGEK